MILSDNDMERFMQDVRTRYPGIFVSLRPLDPAQDGTFRVNVHYLYITPPAWQMREEWILSETDMKPAAYQAFLEEEYARMDGPAINVA